MSLITKCTTHPTLVKVQRLADLKETFQAMEKGRVLLVADDHTYAAAGEETGQILRANGFDVRECVLVRPDKLVPDEKALNEINQALEPDLRYLLAVGSGSINDLMKDVSSKRGLPLITLATAASMDGYASTVAALTIYGYKETIAATSPVMILSVAEVLERAPASMTAAGIGDLLGKYTALADWKIGAWINGERYSEELAEKVRNAVALATSISDDGYSVHQIMSALILSGEVMLEWGDSRPASGAEHHLSHFWEVQALLNGSVDYLHGQKVGIATCLIAKLYQSIFALEKSIDGPAQTGNGRTVYLENSEGIWPLSSIGYNRVTRLLSR